MGGLTAGVGRLMRRLIGGGGEEVTSFYPVRPECEADVPKTRFKTRAGKTLSERRWNAAFSTDGHLDIESVLRRIQRGGVHPQIKGAVWEILLGCYDPNSTYEERNQLRQHRRDQYSRWKTECKNMVPIIGSGKYLMSPIITDDGQPIIDSSTHDHQGLSVKSAVSDKRVIQWMLGLHQIGLDVARTDRALVFYDNPANQAKLWDILAVYSWVDGELVYVQGMNDICSPMVVLFENEADAYWCFEHAMRRLRENFRCSASSIGVQTQLGILSQVIKTVDPKLHQHLEELDGGEYLFAFRMLMVLFRREFSFVDALYLWELMWAMEYNPNLFSSCSEPGSPSENGAATALNNKQLKQCGKFHRNYVKTGCTDQHNALSVFLVASVLQNKNKQILKEAKGLDDLAQILGDTTGNLDARKICNEALKIHKKYLTKCSLLLWKDFLDLCKEILPVIEKFGSAMSPVKSDIGGNITRLETKYLTDPSEFSLLYNLVRSEIKSKTAKSSSNCTNGLLWLTRAMDFLVQLFRNLLAHPDWSMSQVCSDSYSKTLKKWHNWLASSSFSVAMKLAPDRKKFMEVLGDAGDTNSDMDEFCENFSPLQKENHEFLASVGLDSM